MKAISASIIVLAGAIVLTGGAHIQHSDTQMVICIIGGLLGGAGLWAWYVAFTGEDTR